MNRGIAPYPIAACVLAVLALAGVCAAPVPEPARPQVWRYLAPLTPAAEAPQGAAAVRGSTQCMWPRAVNAEAAGAARSGGVESGIGHAFCLRAPDPAAPASHPAGARTRPAYRT